MAPKKRPAAAMEEEEDDALVGVEAAEDGAMGQRKAQDIMNRLKSMAKRGRAFPLDHYKQLKGHDAKRNFCRKFEVDKDCAWLEAQERVWQKSQAEDRNSGGWMHLWDVARLNGISYSGEPAQVTFLESLVASCPSKPSSDAALNEKGHMMYEYYKDYERTTSKSSGKDVSLIATAQVKDKEEWDDCVALLDDTPGPGRRLAKTKQGRPSCAADR